MAKAMYTAWAEVAPDFSKFGRQVDKGFRDTLTPAGEKGGKDAGKGVRSGIIGAVGRLAGPLAAAFAGLKLGQMMVDTIKQGLTQANDLEQTTDAIRTVFGGASAAVEQFAQDAVLGLGIGRQQALESAQMFGVFGKAAGLAGDDLSSFSTDLGTLGADLAAFYGGDIQTALDAISAGLRGESEPLRQYGVLLDDATLKQRAFEMGIYDGTGTLTQQQRVLAAQAEILAQTTDAQGQATKEAASYDGQLKRLSAGWESVVTTIGQLFLPIVTAVVSFLNTHVVPAIQAFFSSIQGGGATLGPFGGFLQRIGEAFAPVIDAVMQILPPLLDLWMNLSPVMILFRALEPILPLIADLLGQVAEVVGGILAEVFTIITPLIEMLAEMLGDILGPILPVIADVLSAVLVPAIELVSAVIDALMPVIEGLMTILSGLIEFVMGVFTGDWDRAWAGVQKIFDGFVQTIQGVIDGTLKLLFEGIPKFIGDIFSNVGNWLVDAGAALIQGFIDGITGMISFVGDAIGGVMDFVGGFFPNSPAERGPFSGAGWRNLHKSGKAVYAQFIDGMSGDGPAFAGIMPPRGPGLPRAPRLDDDAPQRASEQAWPSEIDLAGPVDLSPQTIRELSRLLSAAVRNDDRKGVIALG